jgi:4a-hydroxytetrahydrobiopterin dehydratase
MATATNLRMDLLPPEARRAYARATVHYGVMSQLLSEQEIGVALGTLPDWKLEKDALVREAVLSGFSQAIQVVNRVAEVAENNNHHPDIDIRWATLTFRCSTHSEGGITALDIGLAEEIDGIIDAITG